MISLELLLTLQVIGIVSLLYALITTEAYLWRAIAHVISATIFMFSGVQLLVLVNPFVGVLYLSLSLLVMVVAFTDYLSCAQMAIELKKEEDSI